MDVQSLFGDVPVAEFVGEYLHRLPFALAGSARGACELGSWDAVGEVLACAGEDAFATREGRWYEGNVPRDVAAARALVEDGYTVFVRHAERHHARLAELARSFEGSFCGPVNIHMFVTPPAVPGFSWHYDAEDVFIIQTAGAKEYSLRKNTVNPWPLEETLPADMHYERELMPLMRVLLRAGDLLYIPCGYWHKAEAKATGEPAVSLAVGVMSRSAMELYEFLRERLLKSLVWRQRLPITGSASPLSCEELEATYRQILEQLSADFQRKLADPRLVKEFVDWLAARSAQGPPADSQKK